MGTSGPEPCQGIFPAYLAEEGLGGGPGQAVQLAGVGDHHLAKGSGGGQAGGEGGAHQFSEWEPEELLGRGAPADEAPGVQELPHRAQVGDLGGG